MVNKASTGGKHRRETEDLSTVTQGTGTGEEYRTSPGKAE